MWCLSFMFAVVLYNLLTTLCVFLARDIHSAMRHRRPLWSHLFFMFCLFGMVTIAFCADSDSGSSSLPPMFKATKSHHPVWFMAWCGWLALKYPELVDVIQGDETEPEIDDEDDEDQVSANAEWWKKNKRIYGAVLSAVPSSLKTTLDANARFNGIQALEIIRQRFGVVDAGDRSSALKREGVQ